MIYGILNKEVAEYYGLPEYISSNSIEGMHIKNIIHYCDYIFFFEEHDTVYYKSRCTNHQYSKEEICMISLKSTVI